MGDTSSVLYEGDTPSVENCITHGPWGTRDSRTGNLGKDWNFIPQGFIKKINIYYGNAIDGIEFQSDDSENETQNSLFGSKVGNKTGTICLDFPNEYLTSIRGRIDYSYEYRYYVVKSLCFATNKNRYGQYGSDDEGTRFSYDGKGGVIVGFHGRAGKAIQGIGIYVMPKSLALDGNNRTCLEHSRFQGDTTSGENCIITHGPWVGDPKYESLHSKVGKKWNFMPQGFIKKISIYYGKAIDGIKFQSDCSKDATQKSCFGSKVGNETGTICLDFPNEYLTSIRGRIDHLDGYGYVVMSLCFITNKNRYGPYGSDDEGTRFSYDGKDGVIVGFHGLAGKYVEGIGIYVMPKSLALVRNHTSEQHSRFQKCCKMSTMAMPRDVGPWGASGGKLWDDGVFSNVKQIRVHLGEISKVIYAIQVAYVKTDGKSIWSPKHGYGDGDIVKEVNLDGKEEYLTGVSGYYGPLAIKTSGLEGITSITFHTNKKKYGPYGQKSGAGFTYFTSTSSAGKVVGFHGRDNGFLSAIGVHMEYF